MTISNTLGVSKVLRAGLYERVSTTEQAIKGYSIETQKSNLEEYCENNGIKIVDHYTDEGISGSKPPLKRPQLKRLLEDVEAGKIDIIIFTKLDRWFRNVQEYFKVQEILDKHNVAWKTIFEDYNTDTADGRLKVNIMLSVAANERERTGERIKVVREHKIKNREACFSWNSIPMGYIKKKDENGIPRLVKDPETEHIIAEFWEVFLKTEQLNTAAKHVTVKYNLRKFPKTWWAIAKNELYSGEYRGVKEFCEPYVDREIWEEIQAKRWVKKSPGGRVYLFAGLMKCPLCGGLLASNFNTYNDKEYRRYRCNVAWTGLCSFRTSVAEKKTEKYLLNNYKQLLEAHINTVELEQAKPKPKPKTDINALKEKLRRLNVTYRLGNIDDEEYMKDQKELKALIEQAEKEEPPKERDLTPLKKVLDTDIRSLYDTFTDEEKRRFWRSFIKEIKLDGVNVKEVIFLD